VFISIVGNRGCIESDPKVPRLDTPKEMVHDWVGGRNPPKSRNLEAPKSQSQEVPKQWMWRRMMKSPGNHGSPLGMPGVIWICTWKKLQQSRDLALRKDWEYGQSITPKTHSSVVNLSRMMLGSHEPLIHPTSRVCQFDTSGDFLWCSLETCEARSFEASIHCIT
jgi:hypothetical protein